MTPSDLVMDLGGINLPPILSDTNTKHNTVRNLTLSQLLDRTKRALHVQRLKGLYSTSHGTKHSGVVHL